MSLPCHVCGGRGWLPGRRRRYGGNRGEGEPGQACPVCGIEQARAAELAWRENERRAQAEADAGMLPSLPDPGAAWFYDDWE